MATPSKKSTSAKNAFVDKALKAQPAQSSLKRGLLKEQEDLKNLKDSLQGQEEVFVWNSTKGSFHLAPTSSDALKHEETAHKFELGQIRVFKTSDILEHKDFLKAIAQGKLQIKSDEEVSQIEAAQEKALKKSSKTSSTAGIHSSGLSNNIRAAMEQIWEVEDTDLLEDYKELDDRSVIKEAIDARIAEIEDQG